jgi:hypothetical protein
MPSADGHKDPSLGLLYFASKFFNEVGNVDLTYMKMFRALVRTVMTPEKAPVFELVVSQQMGNICATSGQPPHNYPAGLGLLSA